MKKIAMVLVTPVFFLSGCVTVPVDCDSTDAEASLIRKMNCDHSGAYADQVRRNQDALNDARIENEAFHRFYQATVMEQSQTSMTLAQRQAQDRELRASLNNLVKQIRTRKNLSAEIQQQLSALENEISILESSTVTHGASDRAAKEKKIAELKREAQRLQLSLGY